MISKMKKLVYLIILSTSLIIVGCIEELKSPIIPTWDVSISLPIINRTEIVIDRVKGEKGIFIDSTAQHLLIRFDSTEIKSEALDKIFSDLSYEEEFLVKPQKVDTLYFEAFVSDDSVYLEEMRLYKGTFEYEVYNYLNKKINLKVTLPSFTKTTGVITDTLMFEITIQQGSSGKKFINLANYRFVSILPPTGGNKKGFMVKAIAQIDSGYSGDSIKIKLKLSDLGFNYIRGITKPYESEIKTKTFYLDFNQDVKDILPKVTVYGAKLVLTPHTQTSNLEVRLKNFQVIGLYRSGLTPKFLKIKNQTVLDTVISLSQPSIEFHLDDFHMNEFLSPVVPDSIKYQGYFVLNPKYKSIEVNLPDTVKFDARIIVYSIFKIDNYSRVDTSEVEISEDTKEKIDRFEELNLTFDIKNGLPFGFQITGYFVDAQNRKLFYFTRERGTGESSDTILTLLSANIDSEGKVISSRDQKKIIKLTKDDAQKLKQAKKAIFNVLMFSAERKKVFMQARDKISIRVNASTNFRVGG